MPPQTTQSNCNCPVLYTYILYYYILSKFLIRINTSCYLPFGHHDEPANEAKIKRGRVCLQRGYFKAPEKNYEMFLIKSLRKGCSQKWRVFLPYFVLFIYYLLLHTCVHIYCSVVNFINHKIADCIDYSTTVILNELLPN